LLVFHAYFYWILIFKGSVREVFISRSELEGSATARFVALDSSTYK
jgi:hypothetical protein